MNTNTRMHITFGCASETAYRFINKAFNCKGTSRAEPLCKMTDNCGNYKGDGFELSMDYDIIYIYFDSIENRDFVRQIIDKVADALCETPYYTLADDNYDTEIDISP